MTRPNYFIVTLFLSVVLFLAANLYAAQPNDIVIPPQNISATPKPALPLTPEEAAWLSEHKIIRIAGPKYFPPFHYYEKDGTVKGISSDYTSFLMERLDIQMEMQRNLPWPEVLRKTRQKEIDFIACTAMSSEREGYLSFSNPYLSFPFVIIGRKDGPFISGIGDLYGKRMALIKGAVIDDWLKRDKIAVIPHYVNTPLEALEAVSLNAADAHIENLAAASYMIDKSGLVNLKVAAPTAYGNYNLYFAVRKDWQPLVSIINKALASMTPAEHAAIRNKWLSVRYEYGISTAYVIKLISGIIGVAALMLLLILFWNRKLSREIHERQRAEDSMRESEEKYRTLFNNERTAIYIFELETLRLQDVNDAFVRLYCYSREELLDGMRLTDISAEPEESTNAVKKAVNRGTVFIPLRWHRKKDGTIFPVEIVGGGYELKGQWVMFGIAQDITERKRWEEEQAVLAEIVRVISSTLDIDEVYELFAAEVRKLIPFDRIHVNLKDDDGQFFTIAYVSGTDIVGRRPGDKVPLAESITEVLFRSRKALLLNPKSNEELVSFVPGASAATTYRIGMRSIMAVPLISGDTVIGGLHFRSKTPNAYTEYDLRLAERIGLQISGAIANAQMFSILQTTEHDLRESEEKYRILFNNERAAIYIFDLETLRILDVNEACVRLYGYSREELLGGMMLADISAEPEKSVASFKTAAENGTLIIPLRLHRKKDGTVFPVEIIGGPYAWMGRGVMYGIVQDITDRKEAEDKIQASLIEKETMLKEIHHRVKNNLQVISSLLGLQSSHLQDETAKEAFRESISRVRAMAMVHAHLYQSENLARVDFGHFARELIGNIKQSYGRGYSPVEVDMVFGDVHLDIETSIPCGLIINELVTNAIKHAFQEGRGGKIDIRMRMEDGQVAIEVCDNGIGLSESIDLANPKSLGLRLVNILVGQMKGKIDMQVDGGTRWAMTFPVISTISD